MSLDLSEVITNLRQIEEKLIHQESVMVGIRCEIRDVMAQASAIWDRQAQDAINERVGIALEKGTFAKRFSLVSQNLLGFKRKPENVKPLAPKIKPSMKAVYIEEEEEEEDSRKMKDVRPTTQRTIDSSPQLNRFISSEENHETRPFLRQKETIFSKWLRSDFFRKSAVVKANYDGNSASRSQLTLNDIEDLFSSNFIIHPDSKFKRGWDIFLYLITVLQFFIMPLVLGFEELREGLSYLSGVTCCIFFLDMMMTFRTGIYERYTLIMDRHLISDAYYKSGKLLFDIVTMFPYVYIVDAIVTDDNLNIEWRLISILNAMRILRIAFEPPPFWYHDLMQKIRMKTKINAATVGIIKVLGFMFIYWHWSACIHNIVTEILDRAYLTKYSATDRYTLYFYHSAAEMLAAGFGATPPASMTERWLTILNFICSATIVAVLVGNVSSFMIGLDSSGRIFQEKMDEVSQYIVYKGLDWDLRNRILEFYQYKYSGGKYFDEKKIMTELSIPLRQSILMHNCKSLILKVPFFRDGDNSFIAQVVLALEVSHFLPGDTVIEIGSTGDEMYFIASGLCEVISGGVVRARLSSGSFFGGMAFLIFTLAEISLLFGRMKRTATIKTVTPCVLYSLSKKHLDEVLAHHPNMAHAIRKVAEERLAQQTAQSAAAKPPDARTDSISSTSSKEALENPEKNSNENVDEEDNS